MFRLVAALFFVAAVPVCAAIAIAVVAGADHLIGENVPRASGKRGLVVGVVGIWGTVLFGFLVGQVDRVATWLAPAPADRF
jgi:hypothetical protein